MNDFTVYTKLGRIIMLTVISFIFVLFGILFIFLSTSGGAPVWIGFIGIITAVFFGLCALYYLKDIVKRNPALIISKEGITDHSSFIGAGLIRWEEIEGFDLINFSGQPFLGIYTVDPNLIIGRTSGIKRLLNGANRGLINSQVNIPIRNLACSLEELIDEINKYMDLAEPEIT